MSLAQNRAFLSISSKEPWVCWWSWFTLYASIMAFLMGGVLMVIIGLANIDQLSSAPYNNQVKSTIEAVDEVKCDVGLITAKK